MNNAREEKSTSEEKSSCKEEVSKAEKVQEAAAGKKVVNVAYPQLEERGP